MISDLFMISEEQVRLLLLLFIAHLLSDFFLQNEWMVKGKRWFSLPMLSHIGVVLLVTALLSRAPYLALMVAALP